MTSKSTAPLSSSTWNLLAIIAVAATVHQFIHLLAPVASTTNRIGFALCGYVAIEAFRRAWSTPSRDCRRVSVFLIGTCVILLIAALLPPLFTKAKAGSKRGPDTPKGHLKHIALGFLQYAQDYEDHLPQPGTQKQTRDLISPYVIKYDLWKFNGRGEFIVNPALMGKTVSDFPPSPRGDSDTILAYSDWVERSDGGLPYRYVAYLDARVSRVPEPVFQALLKTRRTTLMAPTKNIP